MDGWMDLLRLASPGQSRRQLAGRREESTPQPPPLGLDCISVDPISRGRTR
ncbi:unnamed protein product, partial [Musa textilis]